MCLKKKLIDKPSSSFFLCDSNLKVKALEFKSQYILNVERFVHEKPTYFANSSVHNEFASNHPFFHPTFHFSFAHYSLLFFFLHIHSKSIVNYVSHNEQQNKQITKKKIHKNNFICDIISISCNYTYMFLLFYYCLFIDGRFFIKSLRCNE